MLNLWKSHKPDMVMDWVQAIVIYTACRAGSAVVGGSLRGGAAGALAALRATSGSPSPLSQADGSSTSPAMFPVQEHESKSTILESGAGTEVPKLEQNTVSESLPPTAMQTSLQM